MPNIAFPSGSSTGAPVAIGTSDTTLHTTVSGKKTEVSLVAFNSDSAADYNLTLKIGGTAISVVKIEKLAGPYVVLPPLTFDAGVTITASCPTASKLYVAATVNVYD